MILVLVIAAGVLAAAAQPAGGVSQSLHDASGVPRADGGRDRALGNLGEGGWQGARTNKNGRELLIVFVGGAPYERGDWCTVRYLPVVRESKRAVRVRILVFSPPNTSGLADCTDVGYGRQVTVRLASPFDARRLVFRGASRPVFDGATLARPSWLPDGFRAGIEQPADADPESNQSWSRTWRTPRPPPVDHTCTPSQGFLTLSQSASTPPEGDRSAWGDVAATYDVHGVPATLWVKPYPHDEHDDRLEWQERGQRFVLLAATGCLGDQPVPADTMLHFARSLVVP